MKPLARRLLKAARSMILREARVSLIVVIAGAAACSGLEPAAPSGGGGTSQSSGGGANTAGAVSSGGANSTAGSFGVGAGTGSGSSGASTGVAGSGVVGGAGGIMGMGGSGSLTQPRPVVSWPSAACQAKTAGILAKMSRKQKAAQMTMADNPSAQDVTNNVPGAIFLAGGEVPGNGNSVADWANATAPWYKAALAAPNGIPILVGVDMVHGNNAPQSTTIFPHNAGLASSHDWALVTQAGQITAQEGLAAGINWAFAPFAGVAWDKRWGRTYESFSEDPAWTADLVLASVLGLQGPMGLGTGTATQPGLVSCGKQWAGDGQAEPPSMKGGVVDRGNADIDLATMEASGIAAYLPALQAGLGSIMVSDGSWMGANMTGSGQLITTLLKGMYGFKGFVCTDYNSADGPGIDATINAGVDMLMEPANWPGCIDSIANSGAISDERINDAVTRILNVKCEAGLFDYKGPDPALLSSVGSVEHRAVARRAVAESLVLLQNQNKVLPLAKTAKVWVGGSGANNLDNQCGGWTISWQGGGENTGTTISQAIGKVSAPVQNMADADVAIVVLSEHPYAEFTGDSATLNTLPGSDFNLLSQAKQAGKRVVAIVISGRPVLIKDHLADADAWVAAWLPGTEGDGVADVLFGMVPFT
ncbi:MAG TPA: glycoside hydrolase family 3 N-terminal domain-containing protein, partial [Polyangiaceae bacterium]|nr:glycoside hydrolase family 3 N-terminal domain-containing protein [Polyangiaceae bacterium]